MAWIAALVSAVASGAAASQQKSASKKANAAAQAQQTAAAGNINAGTQAALQGQQPYAQLGQYGAQSLGALTGAQGYRTPEEMAYSQYVSQGPPTLEQYQVNKPGTNVDTSQFNATGVRGLLDKTQKLSTMGDTIGGVSSYFGRRNRKKAQAIANATRAQQAAIDKKYAEDQAVAQEKYQTDLAAWNEKKTQLEQSSTTSLANYDPMAVLKATPGYQARYQQGQAGVENMQAGRGLGGRAAKEMQKYGQDYASNEYGKEFDRRYQLAGMGQNAANAAGNWSVGQGTQLANINTNQGNLAQQQGQNQSAYYNDINNIVQGGIADYRTQQGLTTKPQPQNVPQNQPTSAYAATPDYSTLGQYNPKLS